MVRNSGLVRIFIQMAEPLSLSFRRSLLLVYGCILMISALIKGVGYWRSSTLRESRLVKTLVRDQVVYFLA